MDNNLKNKNIDVNTKKSKSIISHPYGKSEELSHVIGLKGTMKILYLIEEDPRRYKELNKELKILSQTSLSRRLERLQALNIIKQKPARSERRDIHEYILTSRGELLMKFFQDYEKEIKIPLSQQKVIEIENGK
jgi:DNA-binding HxlR family transcriptional regulator